MGYYPDQDQQTARNVLRRAEISRLTQNLKSRLALATFKTQRGLQNVGLDRIERFAQAQQQAQQEQAQQQAQQQQHIQHLQQHLQQQQLQHRSKREFEGLQQGFTPGSATPQEQGMPAGGRKRAKTFDNAAVAAAAATAGAVGARAPPTSMPAPRGIPASHSVPHGMQRNAYLQPPVMLTSSPETSHKSAQNEPQTPPAPRRQGDARGDPGTPTRNDQDGANLLLYLATSPGRGGMSPRSPGRDLNLHEYVNLFTPSPQVNRQHHLTTTSIEAARQRLTFD